jgi:citronellol/citronellal dehydrogenase
VISLLDTPLPDDPLDLTGKVAVITGGGTGIGAATARLMAAHGASIVLAGRTESSLANVLGELADAGHPCISVRTDVRVDADAEHLIETTVERFGQVDIVVNNAGGSYMNPLADVPPDRWDNAFSLNVRGPYLLTRLAGKHMIERGSGVFVNISSASAHYGVVGGSAYAAAKAALEVFTRQTALEWAGLGIRANAIAVGAVASDGALRSWERAGFLERLRPTAGTPEDIAWTALFLATPASRFINGITILAAGPPISPA